MAVAGPQAAVPALNLSKLPAPVRVHYPTPKHAAPQAHPGGSHVVHRSWPLPPAPPPKVPPKNPLDRIMHQELNQRPKDVVRPPAAHVGGPWWLGTTGLGGRPDGDKMLPARHLRMPAHDLKPIGADAHAPTRHVGVAAPPRAVRFWAKKWPQHGEEARQARRQATVTGVDEGRPRSVETAPGVRKERWLPSRDPAVPFYGLSHSAYIRGSAELNKLVHLKNRYIPKDGLHRSQVPRSRPGSAQSERLRSVSPAIQRPQSACSMRSSGLSGRKGMLLKNVIKADGWSKWSESWENPAYKKTDRISEFKQRILDDLIQEAKFVRVDDSDAYNFGGGAGGRGQGIEIQISPPQKPWKKRRGQTKRTGQPRQSTKVISPGNSAAGRDTAPRRPRRATRPAIARTSQTTRPSDLASRTQKARARDVPGRVQAIIDRSSSTLRHLATLKHQHLTEDEVERMIAPYPGLVPNEKLTPKVEVAGLYDITSSDPHIKAIYQHSREARRRAAALLLGSPYESSYLSPEKTQGSRRQSSFLDSRIASLSPDGGSPASLMSSGCSVEDDNDVGPPDDTFEFTEGEDETISRTPGRFYPSDDYHDEDLHEIGRVDLDSEGVTPKDSLNFGAGAVRPSYFVQQELGVSHPEPHKKHESGGTVEATWQEGSEYRGAAPVRSNRWSSADSLQYQGNHEDSIEPAGPPAGAKDLSEDIVGDVECQPAPGARQAAPTDESVVSHDGSRLESSEFDRFSKPQPRPASAGGRASPDLIAVPGQGAWPAAAAGLLTSVRRIAAAERRL